MEEQRRKRYKVVFECLVDCLIPSNDRIVMLVWAHDRTEIEKRAKEISKALAM